jgi:drug/metabolite transporter (DMT)-like permease
MKDLKGYLMIMGAAVLWGISATIAKVLINQHVETLLIVQSRVTFSCLLLLFICLLFKRDDLKVRLSESWRFALLGILGVAGANFTYYFAIKETTVATAILIQYTAPLAVMGYAAATREEHLSSIKIVAAGLSLLGCFLAVGAYNPTTVRITPLGLLSAVASAVCFPEPVPRHLVTRYNLRRWHLFVLASLFWLLVVSECLEQHQSGQHGWRCLLQLSPF